MTNPITYLLNQRHWNKKHNSCVSNLLDKAENFPEDVRPLLTSFVASSYNITDFLLGPDKGKDQFIYLDSRDVSAEEYRRIHNLNIWAFMALFARSNPKYKDHVFQTCKKFIGMTGRESRMVNQILQLHSSESSQMSGLLFNQIIAILDYDDVSPCDGLAIAPVIVSAYSQAMSQYKQALNQL